MKCAILFLAMLFLIPFLAGQQLPRAVGILYAETSDGSIFPNCTITAVEKLPTGYRFLTALHCVADAKDEVREDLAFSVGHNKYRTNAVTGFHLGCQNCGHDFAWLDVVTDEAWDIIPLGQDAHVGDDVLMIANPNGVGLQLFHGYVSLTNWDKPGLAGEWLGNMLLQLPHGPSASGAAIYCVTQKAICGILLGHHEDFTVALPVSGIRTVKK